MKKKLPSWMAICAAIVVAAAIVLLGNGLTAEKIDAQRQDAERAALIGAMPEAAAFEAMDVRDSRYAVDAAWAAKGAEGETLGYVGKATVTGYGGPVEVTTGVDLGGAITGVLVGGDGFAETPGLGALTREVAFTEQFTGKTPEIVLGEGGVDTVTGASTTSRAVISAVNRVANYFYTGELGLKEEAQEAYTGQTVSATRQGYGGAVTATVGLDEGGAIEYLAIDTPDESDGLGKRCSEPAFTGQFIGKAGPFAYGEDGVDAIVGATITSNAALEAINEIVSGGGEASEAPVSATVQGYGGTVTVTARLNGDNTIAALSVETPDETDGLGKRCSEPAFTDQFIGKAAPFAYGEDGIDAVTGATVTSTAVLDALNDIVPPGDKTASANAAIEPEPTDEGPAPSGGDPARYMRPRPTTAADEETEEPSEPAYMKYMRPRPAKAADEETEEPSEAAYMKYMRPRPATAADDETEEPSEPAYMKYMRPRPAKVENGEAETAEPTAEADAARYMRPRPVTSIVDEAEATEPAAEPTSEADAMRYMRTRPETTTEDEVETTGPAAEPTSEADAMRYMRPRPVTSIVDEAEATEPAAEPTSEADAMRYMRPRPETSTEDEAEATEPAAETTSEADAMRYMRPRPVTSIVDEAEATEPAAEPTSEADAARYMRPRPATVENDEAETAEPVAEADAMRYMRPRPAA